MLTIDYKKVFDTDTSFYSKYYNFGENYHLHESNAQYEYHKLLTYLSYQFNGITIIDIGTSSGESCLALAQNKNNKVITYDIAPPHNNGWKWEDAPNELPFLKDYDNIEVRVRDINMEEPDILLGAAFMFFDIGHYGEAEKMFSDMLENNNYKGYILCDDCYSTLHPGCTKWFSELTTEKYNLTEVGHYHPEYGLGSGLLNYHNDNSVKLIKLSFESWKTKDQQIPQ